MTTHYRARESLKGREQIVLVLSISMYVFVVRHSHLSHQSGCSVVL